MKKIRAAAAVAIAAALVAAPSSSASPSAPTSTSSGAPCLWHHTIKSDQTRTVNSHPRLRQRRTVVSIVRTCGEDRVVTTRSTPWEPVKRKGRPTR